MPLKSRLRLVFLYRSGRSGQQPFNTMLFRKEPADPAYVILVVTMWTWLSYSFEKTIKCRKSFRKNLCASCFDCKSNRVIFRQLNIDFVISKQVSPFFESIIAKHCFKYRRCKYHLFRRDKHSDGLRIIIWTTFTVRFVQNNTIRESHTISSSAIQTHWLMLQFRHHSRIVEQIWGEHRLWRRKWVARELQGCPMLLWAAWYSI